MEEGYVHQFPAFGSWDVSITQYLESARHAGFHQRLPADEPSWDLYTPAAVFHIKRDGTTVAKKVQPVKDTYNWKQGYKVCEVLESPEKTRPPKAVDQDLYKITPELLRRNRRRRLKILSFFSSMFRRRRICY